MRLIQRDLLSDFLGIVVLLLCVLFQGVHILGRGQLDNGGGAGSLVRRGDIVSRGLVSMLRHCVVIVVRRVGGSTAICSAQGTEKIKNQKEKYMST